MRRRSQSNEARGETITAITASRALRLLSNTGAAKITQMIYPHRHSPTERKRRSTRIVSANSRSVERLSFLLPIPHGSQRKRKIQKPERRTTRISALSRAYTPRKRIKARNDPGAPDSKRSCEGALSWARASRALRARRAGLLGVRTPCLFIHHQSARGRPYID